MMLRAIKTSYLQDKDCIGGLDYTVLPIIIITGKTVQ